MHIQKINFSAPAFKQLIIKNGGDEYIKNNFSKRDLDYIESNEDNVCTNIYDLVIDKNGPYITRNDDQELAIKLSDAGYLHNDIDKSEVRVFATAKKGAVSFDAPISFYSSNNQTVQMFRNLNRLYNDSSSHIGYYFKVLDMLDFQASEELRQNPSAKTDFYYKDLLGRLPKETVKATIKENAKRIQIEEMRGQDFSNRCDSFIRRYSDY